MIERKPDGSFLVFHDGLKQPLEAASYPSLVDLTESVMRERSNPQRLFQLHFEGLTEDETAAFMQTMKTKLAAPDRPSLAGFTYGKGLNADRAFKALSAKYDFAKARVVEREVVHSADAMRADLQAVRLKVEIPAFEVAKPPLLLRIRMFLGRNILAPTREALQKLVTEAIGRPSSGVENTQMAIFGIWRRLKALHPGADVRIQYEREALDIYITKARTDGVDHSQGRHAA